MNSDDRVRLTAHMEALAKSRSDGRKFCRAAAPRNPPPKGYGYRVTADLVHADYVALYEIAMERGGLSIAETLRQIIREAKG